MGAANESNCKFKAAERKTPIFITNIHKDTTEIDIIECTYKKQNAGNRVLRENQYKKAHRLKCIQVFRRTS